MIGQTISHYKILEKLGEGGMGVVYKAEDIKIHRPVALKILPRQALVSEEDKTSFAREAQSAGSLSHPNVAMIHEFDEVDDPTTGCKLAFIAMEFVDGETVKKRIQERPLPIPEAVSIAISVAEGLAKAHEKGIIHRDIKSENMMVSKDGVAKIMDFGLAEIAGRTRVTKEGMTVGTTAYMSTEQALGDKLDQRTDIWSLGVVLYEMATGRLPFAGDHEQVILYRILNEEPEAITSLRSNVPMELERIVKKAMQKDRNGRYHRVDDLLVDLKSLGKEIESGVIRKVQHISVDKYRIAVLPLANISPDPQDEYFADGMTEELISTLSKIGGLRVIARTSVMRYKDVTKDVAEIGRELKVGMVLEGSVRKAGIKLRITAQLIDVRTQEHIWSQDYNRELQDVFAIQSDVAKQVAEALRVELLAGEKQQIEKNATENFEAYTLYLKGLYFSSKASPEGFEKALQYFREAIDKDPNFALPYTGVATVFLALGIFSLLPTKEILPKAKAVLDKALELDDTLAEAHATAASMAFWFEWDWKAAENHFKKALVLNPGMALSRAWYGWYQLAMGRFDEAISEIKKAQELDPLMPLFYAQGTGIHLTVGKLDEAMDQFYKAIELDPNFGLAYFHVGRVYFLKGMMEEAISAFQKSLGLVPYSGWAECYLGMIYHLQGEKEKAENLLEELIERKKKMYVSSVCIAILCHELGKPELAYEFYEKAFEERDILMPFIKVHPEHEKHRSDPRFKALLKKMGFHNE